MYFVSPYEFCGFSELRNLKHTLCMDDSNFSNVVKATEMYGLLIALLVRILYVKAYIRFFLLLRGNFHVAQRRLGDLAL